MRIWKRLSDVGIHNKLILMCYAIALFLSVIFGAFVYKTSHDYVIDKVNGSNAAIIRQVAANMEHMKHDLFQTSTLICVNPDFQNYMRDKQGNTAVPDSFIDYITAAKSEISLMIIYDLQGQPLYYRSSDMSTGIRSLSSAAEWDVFEQAKAMDGGPLWISLNKQQSLFLNGNKQNKMVLCRSVKDLYTMEVRGLMVMCVNENEISKQFVGTYEEGESILVYDDSDELIFSSGNTYTATPFDGFKPQKNQQGELYSTYRSDGLELFTAYYNEDSSDWNYFYSIPLENLSYPMRSGIISAFLLVLLSLLITYPLAYFVVRGLTIPILCLLDSMGRFQKGGFEERVEVTGNDEIGKLQIGYNEMVRKIKELIDDAYILKIKEREAELKALQAEINPHFLYNTLDMAYWRAEAQGAEELAGIIYSISRIFRLTLNVGRAVTTVAAEKELIEHYLNLQKMRFYDKFSYEISIPEEMLSGELPKLLLQPFVENAVIHGIEPLDTDGVILISGTCSEEYLTFTIQDNGVGMPDTTIDRLKMHHRDTLEQTGSYAVYNICERLELYYGDRYQLDISSQTGVGTIIVLRIPKTYKARGMKHETTDCR